MIQQIIAYVNFYYPSYKVNHDECFIESCLVYKYLYDTYLKKQINALNP